MGKHILKRHNKTLLLYHLVFPAKYRRKVFTEEFEGELKNICLEIGERYEIHFLEIGADEDHVHFLIQSVPRISITQIVTSLKSVTAKRLFQRIPQIKEILWGAHLWTSVYYANTVGQYANEKVIRNYVKNQGKKYKQIHRGQLRLFDDLI
jgi:putative transposase